MKNVLCDHTNQLENLGTKAQNNRQEKATELTVIMRQFTLSFIALTLFLWLSADATKDKDNDIDVEGADKKKWEGFDDVASVFATVEQHEELFQVHELRRMSDESSLTNS